MKTFLEIILAATLVSLAIGQDYRYHGERYGYNNKDHGGYGGYGYTLCPPLDDPDYGDVKLTGRKPGSKAIHSCDEGYILVGQKVRICQKNGKWSDEPPVCKPIDCGPEPNPDENGYSDVEGTIFRSIVRYFCNKGYVVDTSNGGSQWIYCQADKSWSGTAPSCEYVDCGILPTPANGTVDFKPNTSVGSYAIFSCIRGYKLVGTQSRLCQSNGVWSLSQPKCQRVRCPKLKAPEYGNVKQSGYYVDDYAVYSCSYGYSLYGDYHRVCQQDGTWSGSEPKCNKKVHYGGYGRHHGGYGGHDDKKDYA